MTERSARHATFTIERVYDATPARVFAAWADPAAKRRWFVGPAGKWKELSREQDFQVGGRERVSGGFSGSPVSSFDGRYLDIVPDQRIVYAYDMHLDKTRISVSLATIEFKPTGKGTRLIFTEQAVFLDDYDDAGGREHGTGGLLDNLAAALGPRRDRSGLAHVHRRRRFHVHAAHVAAAHGAGLGDLDRGLDFPGVLEGKRQGKALALGQRLLQAHEHDVIAAGLERERRAGLQIEAGDRAHLHHAVVVGHVMELRLGGDRRAHANQAVGAGAVVRHRDIGGAGSRALGRGARPGVGDGDRRGGGLGDGWGDDGERGHGQHQQARHGMVLSLRSWR
jgi:uncharacterized protein YndB with AHSA1/START domain